MLVHLHGHSHYSLLQALGKPGMICEKAKELGMDTIAITDFAAMYGAVEHYQQAQKIGIKAIIGLEIALVQDAQKFELKEKPSNIVLLAQNYDGYANLMKISTKGNLDGFHEKARIDLEILKEHSKGLIGFMGNSNSKIGNMIMCKESDKLIEEYINVMKTVFGKENFYLEITAQDYRQISDIEYINNKLFDLSKSSNTKLIVNNEFRYINKSDKDAFEVLQCIKDGKHFYDANRNHVKGDYHIMSEDEIRMLLIENGLDKSLITEMIENNLAISKKINLEIELGKILFPNYLSPEEIKTKYEKIKEELVVKK